MGTRLSKPMSLSIKNDSIIKTHKLSRIVSFLDVFYQSPNSFCMRREARLINNQQTPPTRSAEPPLVISVLRFVWKPIAVIAIIIINFERSFNGENTAGLTPSDIATVVISEAKRNQRIKLGTALVSENASFVLSFRDCHTESPRVIGMIASVRVNLTIVACSRMDVPCKLSQELAVAVTEEVSLTAVPANMAKP